jgi:hypothetical protein
MVCVFFGNRAGRGSDEAKRKSSTVPVERGVERRGSLRALYLRTASVRVKKFKFRRRAQCLRTQVMTRDATRPDKPDELLLWPMLAGL